MKKMIIVSQIIVFSICLMILGAVNCPDGSPAIYEYTNKVHYKDKLSDDKQPDNSQVTWCGWVPDYETFSHDGSTAFMTFKRSRSIQVKYKEYDVDYDYYSCPDNITIVDRSEDYNTVTKMYVETEPEEKVETGTVESGINPPGSSDYQISTWEVIETGGAIYTMFQMARGLLSLLLL